MAENASLFLSYGEFQNVIRLVTRRDSEEKLPLYQLALAAAGAGAVTSFILYVLAF
jgi:ornithine carrier protein